MVTVNGAFIEHTDGMVLSDALMKAGVDTGAPMLITVNGVYAEKNKAGHITIPDNADIRIMPLLSGG